METIKKEKRIMRPKKEFDAVKMMREIRDKISAETQNMTFEELKDYINQKLSESKTTLIGKASK
jgi:hypothetical protein